MADPSAGEPLGRVVEALTVHRRPDGSYLGSTPDTQMQRTFGGLVAGQAMVAVVDTVDPRYVVHSLHAYFVRPGRPDLPIEFDVEQVRDGRSFAIRRVVGTQGGRTIFMGSASFQVEQQGPEHQEGPVRAPGPDEVGSLGAFRAAERAAVEWPDWDIRQVPPSMLETPEHVVAHSQIWFRNTSRLPDEPVFHVCALTYMSDMTLLIVAREPHPGVETEVASLDHALWFLRPFRADDWLLYDARSPSAGNGRALTVGRIYDRAGRLVARSVQEGLMRFPLDG